MSVEKTERKEENVALISYLEERLVYQHSETPNENKPIFNTYVVFVEETFLNAHANTGQTADTVALEIYYDWKFQFLDAEGNVLLEQPYDRTSRGIMHINSIQMEDDLYYTSDLVLGWEAWLILHSDWERAAFFKMSVELYKGFSSTTPLVELSLEHEIRGTGQVIESLKSTHSGNNQSAYLGREPVTRMMADDYRFYLLGAKEQSYLFNGTTISTVLTTPNNVVAGLMYQNAIQGILEPRFGKNDLYDSILNLHDNDVNNPDPFMQDGEPDSKYVGGLKTGVVQVKPHILAMFLPKDENWTTYTPFLRIGENDITEESLFNNFAQLTPEEHYDIYNYLRFPKTNIKSAALILHGLKEAHSEWANLLTDDELGGEPEAVRTIATEFWQGPQADVDDYSPEALKSFPIGWSPYIQAILLDNSIEYETIHIKVLDVRSGQPIPSARVKKIIIRAVDANNVTRNPVVNEFSPYSKPIPNGPLELRAQQALKGMGYDIDNPNTSFGLNEIPIYNAFLSHRVPNDTGILLPVDGSEDPSDPHMEYIIGEYQEHRKTDENGVLHIRVPLDLMHGNKVHLEVGFWEFPIVLEKIVSNDDANALMRTNNVENQTDFKISWVIDYQDVRNDNEDLIPIDLKQSVDWEDTILRGGHFGWKVEEELLNQEGMLKVCEKLVIKEDAEDFVIFSTDHFSPFYDEDDYPIHFIFFGMQWCQPVYDNLLDGLLGGNPNYTSLTPDPLNSNRNMHLITHHTIDPSPGYGGKDYGKPIMRDFWTANSIPFQILYEENLIEKIYLEALNEWFENGEIGPEPIDPLPRTTFSNLRQQRLGVKLEARVGDPIFAMRGGYYEEFSVPHHSTYDNNGVFIDSFPPFSHTGTIYWEDGGLKSISYLHLGSGSNSALNSWHDIVMCGQVIAGGGRSLHIHNLLSDEPGYLGLYVGDMENGQMVFLRDSVDPANRIVFPTTDLPLIFPCRTQVTQDMLINNSPITEDDLEVLIYQNNGGEVVEEANQQTPLYLCQFADLTIVNN